MRFQLLLQPTLRPGMQVKRQLFGAHLWITGMDAGSGPGIEFLEYLTPRDGRPRARDAKANDLIHWQTTLVPGSRIDRQQRASRASVLRHNRDAKGKLCFGEGALIRDPFTSHSPCPPMSRQR